MVDQEAGTVGSGSAGQCLRLRRFRGAEQSLQGVDEAREEYLPLGAAKSVPPSRLMDHGRGDEAQRRVHATPECRLVEVR